MAFCSGCGTQIADGTTMKDGRPVTFALHGFIEFKTLADMFPYIDSQRQRWKTSLDEAARQRLASELLRRGIESRVVSMRSQRLTDRKHELRRLLTGLPATSRLRYADHIEQHGTALFQRVCEMDLEGIVAKHSFGPYTTERERST